MFDTALFVDLVETAGKLLLVVGIGYALLALATDRSL